MENETDMVQDGVQFDPGFIKHMSAIVPNIQYVYDSLNRIKNFNQKKQQFKMYYPKIITLLETYMSFYAGCILWGVYIKTIEHAPLLNNLCYGGEYSEEETLSEVEFIRNYLEQMKKDVKYYMGKDFSFNPEHLKKYAQKCHYIVRVMREYKGDTVLYNYDVPNSELFRFMKSFEENTLDGTIIEIDK